MAPINTKYSLQKECLEVIPTNSGESLQMVQTEHQEKPVHLLARLSRKRCLALRKSSARARL